MEQSILWQLLCLLTSSGFAKNMTGVKTLNPGSCHPACVNMGAETTVAPNSEWTDSKVKAFEDKRLAREWKTMAAMVRIYCRDQHGSTQTPCPECQQFLEYANLRLDRCRFGVEKPTCANCPVHCYQRARREQARTVMRYAGPRMLWHHPWLSLRHWLDGYRKAPAIAG